MSSERRTRRAKVPCTIGLSGSLKVIRNETTHEAVILCTTQQADEIEAALILREEKALAAKRRYGRILASKSGNSATEQEVAS